MFDKADINLIGKEYENGLKAYKDVFSKREMTALRTGFEIGMMNAFTILESRVQTKRVERIERD